MSSYVFVLKLMSYYPLGDLCIFHGVLDIEVVAGGLYFFSLYGQIIPYFGSECLVILLWLMHFGQ